MVLKNKKGITLIALVITIIVMLILVAVTINMAVNGGLFGYAGNAASETRKAKNEEQKLGAIPNNLTTSELIEKFTNIHTWTVSGNTFTCSHCGASYTIGEQVNYTPNASKTSTMVSGADSGVEAGIIANKYNASDFGTNGEQTISRENGLIWIVLGLDKDGVLLITTSTPTATILSLYGKKAYINGPDIMNKVCEDLYSSTIYGKARSINIDDVNSVLGWTETQGVVTTKTGGTYKVSKGTKFGEVGTGKMKQEDWDAIKDNNQTPEPGKALTDYEINGYYYNATYNTTEMNNINNIRKNVIFGTVEGTYYNLASFGSHAVASVYKANFSLGYVYKSSAGFGVYLSMPVFTSDGKEHQRQYGLRPVVPLKSELPEVIESDF